MLGFNFLCRKLPKLLRRHPLAVISTVGFVMFLSVFLYAETQIKQDALLYAPGNIHVKEESLGINHRETNGTTAKPVNIEDDSGYFRLDQAVRRKRMSDICSETHPVGLVNALIPSKFNLTYCPIPRTFNTFWLQVFRFLNHDFTDGDPQSPFDLNPEEAYNRPFIKTRRSFWKMLSDEQKQELLNTRIFLAVQDPYMRLWSTYIHTLILPEKWETIGQMIEAKRPRRRPQPIAFFQPRQLIRCGNDITFEEFINFTLNSYEKDFAPYYRLCNPCQLRPTYVIKAETAQRDNTFILKHADLAWTMEGSLAKQKAIMQYISSIVSGSFKRLKNPPPRECNMTISDVAHRLWRAFVVEGLIPEGMAPPSFESMDQSQFINMAVDRATSEQQTVRHVQKRKYMVAAFRKLEPEMLDRVRERYEMDFKLFDYDPRPSDIYVKAA